MNRNLIAIFAATGLAIMTGCSGQQPAKTAEAKSTPTLLSVSVRPVQTKKVDRFIQVTGSLFPDETTAVSAEVAGRVEKVYADFGYSVQKGQVLVELDRRELTWQLERARAGLAQAKARIGLRPEEDRIPDTTPAIRQAEAQLVDSRFKFENAQKLVKTGDIAEDRFREIETLYASRKAALDAARDDLKVQQAMIESLRAEVSLAEKRLSDTVIRAPFDGAIIEKMVSPGQFVRDNAPLFRVVKTSPLRLRLDVPESAATSLRISSQIEFQTDAAPGETFRAVVQRVSPSLDAQSRSLSAEARMVNSDPRLKPGMFVQVNLVTQRDFETVIVPQDSVYHIAGLNKVFSVRSGKVREHKVAVGRQWDGWVEVFTEGLQAGDTVALDNLSQLVEGQSVEPAPAKG